jgi:hypothetical protein
MKVMHIDEDTAFTVIKNLHKEFEHVEQAKVVREFIKDFCKTFGYIHHEDGRFTKPC